MNRMVKYFSTHELDEHYQGETPDELQIIRWICFLLLPRPIRKLLMGGEYVVLCPFNKMGAHNG